MNAIRVQHQGQSEPKNYYQNAPKTDLHEISLSIVQDSGTNSTLRSIFASFGDNHALAYDAALAQVQNASVALPHVAQHWKLLDVLKRSMTAGLCRSLIVIYRWASQTAP